MDPITSARTYWSILKTLLSNKKIPFITPLFHRSKYEIDFRKKAEVFNLFFTRQCSIIHSCKLPLTLSEKTEKSISKLMVTI